MWNLQVYVARDRHVSNVEVFHSADIDNRGGSFYSREEKFEDGHGGHPMGKESCIRDFGFFPEMGEAWHCTLSDDQSFWWIEKVKF
jgi:hypothetical protein